MLDAEKLTHLTSDVVYAMSEAQWLTVSWHLATDGIVSGNTSVLKTNQGAWRISCESMADVSALISNGEILIRLHQLTDIRPLPEVHRIIPVPPMEFGSPMALLKSISYKKMPDDLWLSFAWRMAVDKDTAQNTVIVSTKNGVWHIRCHSEHAWNVLHHPEPILAMLRWIGGIRELPQARVIVPVLGEIRA